MPLKKLVLKPGINKEGTNYSNEDGFYNCDKIRFRSGYAEKLGGWQNIGSYTYYGIARSLWAWVSLNSENLVGLGTTQKFYIEYGTKYYDITPIRTTLTLDSPYFSTTNGSSRVKVNNSGHSATPGSFVTFTKAYTTLNGNIDAGTTSIVLTSVTGFASPSGTIQIDNEVITYAGVAGSTLTGCSRGSSSTTAASHLSGATVISLQTNTVGGVNLTGEFQITEVPSTTYYYIIAPTTASLTATGGSGTKAIYQINASSGSYTALAGWSGGGWGGISGVPSTGWGLSSTSTLTTPFRLWSQSNFDEDLIFAPRFGSIYWWTKNTNAFPRAITINEQANSVIKTTLVGNGTSTGATYVLGATSIVVTDTTGINFGSVVTGTGIPAGAYVSNLWDQSTTIPLLTAPGVSAVTTAPQTYGTVNFSYAGRHIPVETLVIATTSQNAFTIAFGATPYNPRVFSDVANFDPLLVRWSDQDQPYEWVPSLTNQSGEQRLANGSMIMAAANTRQEILVWTDTAIYSMQYLGPPYVFGINLLMDNLSIASQNAAITVNNVTYWMGVDRFYMYSGRVETLPCTLRQFVFGNINRSQLSQVCVGTNEGFNEIWWFYPSAASSVNDSYVIYNHLENTWYYGTMNRTTWLDTQLLQYPIAAASVEKTFLNSGSINPSYVNFSIPVSDTSSYPTSGSLAVTTPNTTVAFAFWVRGSAGIIECYTTFPPPSNYFDPYYYGIKVGDTVNIGGGTNRVITAINFYDDGYGLNYYYMTLSAPLGVPDDYYACFFNVSSATFIFSYTGKSLNTFTGCNLVSSPRNQTNIPQYSIVSSMIPNQLMYHEYNWDDGSVNPPVPYEAYVESSDFDIDDGLNFAYVWRIIPDLTFSGSTTANPVCQLTVKVRQNSGAAYTPHSSDTQTVERTATYPVEQYTGQVYTRVRGRQMAFRMGTVVTNGTGIFWQMGMMRIDLRSDGRR
jgi:hypothetical protein